MIVVVGTNVHRADLPLTKPSTSALFESAEIAGYRLCVPAIVRDEVSNLFVEQVEKANQEARTASGRAGAVECIECGHHCCPHSSSAPFTSDSLD